MKRIFRIIIFVFAVILFLTFIAWVIGIYVGANMSFTYLLGYLSTMVLCSGLFVLGMFGLHKLGDWAFKKD